jgi:hypothetical protein
MQQSLSSNASSHLATQETVCFSKTLEQGQHKPKCHYINMDLNPFAAYYFLIIFLKYCNLKVKIWEGSNKTAMDKHSKGNRHIFATFHCERSKCGKISPSS